MSEMPSELNLYSDLALVGLWHNPILYMHHPLYYSRSYSPVCTVNTEIS